MNNKTLFIVFFALLGLFLLSRLTGGKKERSFDPQIIAVDTSLVTSIILYPKSEGGQEIILKKESDGWTASNGSKKVIATDRSVSSILSTLVSVKAERIAAKNKDKWPEYEVDEKSGTRVKVFQGEKVLTDMIVGRFNFNQQQAQGGFNQGQRPSGTSFVRLSDSDNVYAIDGFFSMSFGQDFNSFRDRTLLQVSKDDITEISMVGGEADLVISNIENKWMAMPDVQLDSTKVDSYLSSLSNLSGSNFNNNFSPETIPTEKRHSLTINLLSKPAVILTAYQTENIEEPWVIESSINPDAYFNSKESGIYSRMFKKVEDLQ